MKEGKRITPTIGVFGGILSLKTGKLLLRKRQKPESSPGNWELPGGAAEESDKVPYHYLTKELLREIGEEVGMDDSLGIHIDAMPPMYALLFKGPNGFDLAMVTFIPTWDGPTKGETKWVDVKELNTLAREYQSADKEKDIEGKGLVSGWGKRMHCMALQALCESNNPNIVTEARNTLSEIQEKWE